MGRGHALATTKASDIHVRPIAVGQDGDETTAAIAGSLEEIVLCALTVLALSQHADRSRAELKLSHSDTSQKEAILNDRRQEPFEQCSAPLSLGENYECPEQPN
jgi:hypothetical protein